MACGMLDPRYRPGLVKERPANTEEGGDAVVADEASLFPPLGIAALTPLIALPGGGVGDIDVDAMAADAAPPTGETLTPPASRADSEVPRPHGAAEGDGAHPPAACAL